MSQIADARGGMLTAGKADGVRVIDVKTGGGFSFSILPSRGWILHGRNIRERPSRISENRGRKSGLF